MIQTIPATYDTVAAEYDAAFQRPVDLAENAVVFRQVRHLLKPGCRVLDVGCGTGLFLDYLGQQIAPNQYTGLDISRQMLSFAHFKHPRYRFTQGDMGNLSRFRDASFDVVVNLFGSYIYTNRPATTVREMARVLKPGGRFFLMPCTPRYAHRPHYILNQHAIQPQTFWYTAERLRRVFEMNAPGLDVQQLRGFHWFPETHFPQASKPFQAAWLWAEGHTVGRLFPNDCYFLLASGVKRA